LVFFRITASEKHHLARQAQLFFLVLRKNPCADSGTLLCSASTSFTTATSDNETGTFSLALPGLRPGAKVPLDIVRSGYAVINREATQPRLPNNPLERTLIHEALYLKYADKAWPDDRHETFREVFLASLRELEEAGITHPDVAKIRTLLSR
jgi:hypothetical protein